MVHGLVELSCGQIVRSSVVRATVLQDVALKAVVINGVLIERPDVGLILRNALLDAHCVGESGAESCCCCEGWIDSHFIRAI